MEETQYRGCKALSPFGLSAIKVKIMFRITISLGHRKQWVMKEDII